MQLNEKANWRLSLGLKYFNEEPRNVPAAVREFGRVTQLAPDWSQGYALLAAALEEDNDIDRAIATCRGAIRIAPEDVQHLIFLSRICIRKSECSKAASTLYKAILLRPDDGDVHRLLAEALSATEESRK